MFTRCEISCSSPGQKYEHRSECRQLHRRSSKRVIAQSCQVWRSALRVCQSQRHLQLIRTWASAWRAAPTAPPPRSRPPNRPCPLPPPRKTPAPFCLASRGPRPAALLATPAAPSPATPVIMEGYSGATSPQNSCVCLLCENSAVVRRPAGKGCRTNRAMRLSSSALFQTLVGHSARQHASKRGNHQAETARDPLAVRMMI